MLQLVADGYSWLYDVDVFLFIGDHYQCNLYTVQPSHVDLCAYFTSCDYFVEPALGEKFRQVGNEIY